MSPSHSCGIAAACSLDGAGLMEQTTGCAACGQVAWVKLALLKAGSRSRPGVAPTAKQRA